MRLRSTDTPPKGALTWPSSDEPAPKGITGTPCSPQMRTISTTSSVVSGNTTASGGWLTSQVVVWPCWRRTASESAKRSPNRCLRIGSAAAMPASLRAVGVDRELNRHLEPCIPQPFAKPRQLP